MGERKKREKGEEKEGKRRGKRGEKERKKRGKGEEKGRGEERENLLSSPFYPESSWKGGK
jgi:hypothetical protein